ncbi:hypothetical protein AGDE_13708 [Angomonas deanei]|uniref:Uncharacterized protein n=1 Tax=Angomonas deanei TaxID=59799 RepID=A0A7G2C3D3_9TRYP|nr:hypothetical protein AGDE_13708 [Angomonas deanei]CAD2213217.1 hypothetical protein, conserved [Angomonas deanei]|eukprot:EPY21906.1 hypothetical protein AGDE_13708 [Angomonas deanei]
MNSSDYLDNDLAIKERDAKIERLYATIRDMAEQLHSVAEFVEIKDDVEERIEKMRAHYEDEVISYKEETKHARMETLEERVRMRTKEAELLCAHEDEVNARATELLDERTKEINTQNFDLYKEKVLLTQDVDETRTQLQKLEKENAALRRKLDLSSGTEKELLARSVKQKKEVAELKAQVRTMDDSVNTLVEQYEGKLAAQEAKHAKEVKTLTTERDDARRDAQRLLQELTKLRGVSSQLLNERSELEQFFHTALQEVREEIIQERKGVIGSMPLGTTNAGSHTASSRLRLETQDRLHYTDGAPRSANYTKNKKGFPVRTKPGKASLPPIGSADEGAVVPYLNPDLKFSSSAPPRADFSNEEYYYDPQHSQTQSQKRVPDAPTLKELQRINIHSLSWAEKERVILYLFKHIQQQQSVSKMQSRKQKSTVKEEEPADSGEVKFDSDTFLTA